MKVCMISGAYPAMKCGIGDYTARLVKQLAEEGIQVEVLSCRSPRVLPSSHPSVQVFPVLSAAPALDARAIARHVQQHGCEVIHVQYPTWPFRRSLSISFLPALLKVFGGVPVVVTLHEVARCHPFNKLRLIPIAYTSAALTVTTEEDYQWLARRLPGVGGRAVHIPIGTCIEAAGVPDGGRRDFRRSLGITNGEVAMCHFGFVLKNKLIEDLLTAARIALDRGARLRLVFMTGFDRTEGSYGSEIQALIDKLHLRHYVIETGFLPVREVSRCFRACDFAVLLFRDGASFRRSSMLAAMAHGLPVVSCRTGQAPPGLKHGENILLSETGDVEALAENMVRLCRDHGLRQRLAARSIETSGQFGWSLIASRTISLYRKMLS